MTKEINKINNLNFSKLNGQDYIFTRMQQNIQNTFDQVGDIISGWQKYLFESRPIKNNPKNVASGETYIFDFVETDNVNAYNKSNGKYKCQTSALYFINFGIFNTSSTANWTNSIGIFINNELHNVLYYKENLSSGLSDLAQCSKMFILNAGDIIEIKNTGSTCDWKIDGDNASQYNYLQVWFLC